MRGCRRRRVGCVGVARLVSGDALRSGLGRATFVASSSWEASARAGLPGRGDREPRTINVADHGHDLDRVAIGVLLVAFAEEQSAARGSRQAAQ
jgi:hypothetical protein